MCLVVGKYASGPILATALFGSHTLFFVGRHHHAVAMVHLTLQPTPSATELVRTMSDKDREGSNLLDRWSSVLKIYGIDLAYMLLQSLPRSRLAGLRDRISPLLEFDILGVRFLFNLFLQLLT